MKDDNQTSESNNNFTSQISALQKKIEELGAELETAHKTIEQLQEIRRLTHQFIHVLCNYELRTPLSFVVGYARFILEGDDPLTEKQNTDLAMIRKKGQEIGKVLNETLGLLHIEEYNAGFRDILCVPEEVNLRQNIERAMSSLKERIEIQASISDDLPKVWADALKVDCIIHHLALALSEEFKEKKISLDVSYDDDWVIVKITNPEFIVPEYILEDFVQSKPILTMFDCSALSICRYLVEIQGGKMHLDTQKETGTSVTLTLPVYKNQSSVILES